MNKLKNLQISSSDLVGNKFNGHDLHLYLNKMGIRSEQLVWNKESNDNDTYSISRSNSELEMIKKSFIDLHKKYSLDSLCNILTYDILYNQKFLETDVVHYHLINDHFFDLQLLPLMTRLKPTVWTLHDPWPLGGHCVHHFNCSKWLKQCSDCPYLKTHFSLEKDNSALNFSLKKDAIQNSSMEVVVASKWMEKKVKSSPIFKGKKVHRIPFGINQNLFKPLDKTKCKQLFGINPESIVLTFRYDESEFKGLDFIDYLLKNLHSNKDIFLLIVGYPSRDAKYKYNNYSHKKFNWVKDDKLLAKIYSATDLFLMPSKMETFGMMAIEAMSCATLPIVLEGNALPEIVASPEVGIATERTKKAFTQTVNFYINHDSIRNKRAKKCLTYAKRTYNYQNYVSKIISVYREAMRKHHLNEEDRILLSQLKLNMMETADNSSKVYIRQNFPVFKKFFFIVFYKIDKIIPRRIRTIVKQMLMKIKFFEKLFKFF